MGKVPERGGRETLSNRADLAQAREWSEPPFSLHMAPLGAANLGRV
jgi:hypothetical protein